MIDILILLLFWHALADFPLQGDFLARWKDHKYLALPDKPGAPRNSIWQWCLVMHCLIQAGGVYLVTGWWVLFVLELVAHGVIDLAKCKGRIDFHLDQTLHLSCKLVWVILLVLR